MIEKQIQVITYNGKDMKYDGKVIKQNSLHDIQSLDEFDINVIDLSSSSLWEYQGASTETINSISDFISISEMIYDRKKSKLIILYPQNGYFRYRQHAQKYSIELKNMINVLSKKILDKLYQPLSNIEIVYENTRTLIQNQEIVASFYFKDVQNMLLSSEKSQKATAFLLNNVILSTLNIENTEQLFLLLEELGLLEQKQAMPDWFLEIQMFDDSEQQTKIKLSKEKIESEQKNIDDAQAIIDVNNHFKSVLYTTGDELVEVIFEIFEEILSCDLSGFVDVKKEDLLIELEDAIFIGEIKGVNPNVKSTNISQVDTHYHDYLETHPETDENKLKALLIINHQKNKAIEDREPVMEQQINLAKRNNSLIIETHTLLRALELYRIGKVTRDKFIKVLRNKKGLLEITDFD